MPLDREDREPWAYEDPRWRYELPPSRMWYHDHHGQTDRVRIGFAEWPDVAVFVRPSGSNVEVAGAFSLTGRLHRLQFDAGEDGEVTTSELRWPGAIRALKEWESVARQLARQMQGGKKPEKAVFDARTPTEALRILSQAVAPRSPKSVRRGAEFEQLLREVAEAYRDLAGKDPKPRVTLANRYGYTPQHIGWLLGQARKERNGQPPLLGPARPGRAGEEPSGG